MDHWPCSWVQPARLGSGNSGRQPSASGRIGAWAGSAGVGAAASGMPALRPAATAPRAAAAIDQAKHDVVHFQLGALRGDREAEARAHHLGGAVRGGDGEREPGLLVGDARDEGPGAQLAARARRSPRDGQVGMVEIQAGALAGEHHRAAGGSGRCQRLASMDGVRGAVAPEHGGDHRGRRRRGLRSAQVDSREQGGHGHGGGRGRGGAEGGAEGDQA